MFRILAASALALSLLAVIVLEPHGFAETSANTDSRESDETARLIEAELPHWKVWLGDDRTRVLKLEPKSVLRWTNPATVRVYGDVFVWTFDGRPEAVMSLFKVWEPPRGLFVEAHSLSRESITAERNGSTFWRSTRPGIEFSDIPEAPAPAESKVHRLSQMRDLAKGFSVDLGNENGEQVLRLLTQPIYRYESKESDVVDGAIFAIVLGTDPEVLVMIEARRSDGDLRWQYALARMNDNSIVVNYHGHEVWRAEPVKARDPLRDPYCLVGIPES